MYLSQTSRDSHASPTQPEFLLVKKTLEYTSYFSHYISLLATRPDNLRPTYSQRHCDQHADAFRSVPPSVLTFEIV